MVTHWTRIREVPGSNPGADQPDCGGFSVVFLNNQVNCWVGVVVVQFFTSLLTSRVISVAFYSEREKSNKFCSESLFSAWGSFTCRKSTALLPFRRKSTQDFYDVKKFIGPGRIWPANLGASGECDNHWTTGVDCWVGFSEPRSISKFINHTIKSVNLTNETLPSDVAPWYCTRLAFGRSRVQIPWPANLVEIFSGFLILKIAKELVIFKRQMSGWSSYPTTIHKIFNVSRDLKPLLSKWWTSNAYVPQKMIVPDLMVVHGGCTWSED